MTERRCVVSRLYRCVAKKSSEVKYKGLSDYRRTGLNKLDNPLTQRRQTLPRTPHFIHVTQYFGLPDFPRTPQFTRAHRFLWDVLYESL